MPTTETFLFIYYLGCGFVIFLGWMCVADPRTVSLGRRRGLRRLAVGLAVAGVLHPVLALAGRDIGVQLRLAEPTDPEAVRTVRIADRGVAAALVVLAAVLLSQLGPLEGVPLLRHIRAGLPYD